jgi:hypothetical protein
MTRDASKLPAEGDDVIRDRVQELVWALVDDQIADDEMRLLDNLLLSDDGARETYVGCVQLHSDLVFHFADAAQPPATSGAHSAPVLGTLGEGFPPLEPQPSQQ